jgi:heavy metal sensor kinase
MIRSIRLRFIFWYILILAVTFSVFAFVLYFHVSSNLKGNLDDVLLTKADGIAASINTYWETEKMDALKHGARKNVFSKINNLNFLKVAKRWVEERSNDPDLMDIIVQIYKPDGELIAYSPNAPARLSIPKEALHSLTKQKASYEDRHVPVTEDEYLDLRILQIPVSEEGEIAYIVQVASPLSSIWATLKGLKLILFILLPITVVLAGALAGEFLASITLKPLKNMIATARQITAENMSLRIAAPDTKDEIRQLAETFNDMLEKIQRVFISQKQFIQDVSHELRTPLTIMRGELEVALKRQRSLEEYRSTLMSSLDEIKKIGNLLENLLALARFDSSSAGLTKEFVEVSTIMRDILDDRGRLAQQKGIKIEFVSQDGIILPLDRDKIMRAFINILDNAIKYTPENGRISIEIIQEIASAIITITDTGIGIPEDDLPHIFDRFYQADKSRSSAGFGLGLSIAKSIIEAHEGSITVESIQHQGTTFLISLPMKGSVFQHPADLPPDSSNMRIF